MASLHTLKSNLSPITISPSNFPGKSDSRKTVLRFRTCRGSPYFVGIPKLRVWCRVQDDDNQSKSEEPPESLFMKELRRRGMTPTSLLEDTKRSNSGLDDELKLGEDDRGFAKRNAVSTEYEGNLTNQRERSMALNSEGLEGLIPRAKLLLATGGTFFLGFWPLIIVTVAFFSALYVYFGTTFIHDGSQTAISPPQYVDPYELLEDERISQMTQGAK
ncbi:uncharacterized protein LOC119982124 isoform X2 [Tripterygium wilfordii]|uniref:uncharacterized protein LOC119982124 isoform X2 n=1 Tax=Tripterygium wilfordii TaxID=458696 RepID=UPI0018F7FB85|nr:uncharacterized protein LOC119982124 isoform X2 [Tripterygium wilfordii]